MPPAVIDEHTLILICVLMLMGGAFVAAIFIVSQKDLDRSLETPKPWICWLGVVALFFFLTRPGPEPAYISAADRVMIQHNLPRSAQHILINLNDCPGPGQGMTDQVLLLIRSRADAKPVVAGCSRIAERAYLLTKGSPQ